MTAASPSPAEPDIAVTIQCGDWTGTCAEAEADAARAARLALAHELAAAPRLDPATPLLLDITLDDDQELRRLNRTYRGVDAPTNVLAFPATDRATPLPPGAPYVLGDVVLALTTIRREAAEQGKTFADHLRHLVVHGVLHLLGYDHHSPAEATDMEAREIAILAELGVPDPYRDTM